MLIFASESFCGQLDFYCVFRLNLFLLAFFLLQGPLTHPRRCPTLSPCLPSAPVSPPFFLSLFSNPGETLVRFQSPPSFFVRLAFPRFSTGLVPCITCFYDPLPPSDTPLHRGAPFFRAITVSLGSFLYSPLVFL